jgi:hypothetical protein
MFSLLFQHFMAKLVTVLPEHLDIAQARRLRAAQAIAPHALP